MMDESKKQQGLADKASKIQNKIMSIARMRLLMRSQKEKSEQMISNGAAQGAPGGGLLEGPAAINKFYQVKDKDMLNEKRPDIQQPRSSTEKQLSVNEIVTLQIYPEISKICIP
eukprot:GABU01005985.1.p1 GENE.GABU01005985.1~~GABU01005985.1.p1  ORF type:complete len:128 (-),score=23.96 GABU01005985.1:44-385(-)